MAAFRRALFRYTVRVTVSFVLEFHVSVESGPTFSYQVHPVHRFSSSCLCVCTSSRCGFKVPQDSSRSQDFVY